jgi:hypothetical protein
MIVIYGSNIFVSFVIIKNQDSSVITTMSHVLDGLVSIPSRDRVSYPIGTEGCFVGGKAAGA